MTGNPGIAQTAVVVTEELAEELTHEQSVTSLLGDSSMSVVETPSVSARESPPPIVRRQWSGLVKSWLIGLPVFVFLPAAYTYLAVDHEIDIPFYGTIDLAEEAAAVLAGWGFTAWASVTVALLPTLVAFGRRTRNRGAVAAVNLLLGLTGIGWLVAFVLSFSSEVDEPVMVETRRSRRARLHYMQNTRAG